MKLTITVLFLITLTACGGADLWDRVNDADLPIVVNLLEGLPSDGAANVTYNTPVSARFDDNILMTSVTGETFSVTAAGVPVDGDFSYDDLSRTVIFSPSSSLDASTCYSVNLSTGITNPAGEPLATGYSWSFTTADAPVPEIYADHVEYNMEIMSGYTMQFGSLMAGDSRSYTLRIGNSGTKSLSVSSLDLSGTDAALFSLAGGAAPFTVSAGSYKDITVTFAPGTGTLPGVKNASLSVGSDDSDENPFVVNLTGECLNAATSDIAVLINGVEYLSGSTYQFGTYMAGTSSPAIPVVVENRGVLDLVMSDVIIGGVNPEAFTIDMTGFDYTLAASEMTDFTITFTASTKLVYKASVTITSNDPDESPFILNLMGRGRIP